VSGRTLFCRLISYPARHFGQMKPTRKPRRVRKPNKWRVAKWRLDWYRDFGERLRATRLALGITEAEAAAAWLITLRTYRRREADASMFNDHGGPWSFVDKYGIDLEWLVAGKGSVATALTPRSRRATFKPA
jgi:hypothetical protein